MSVEFPAVEPVPADTEATRVEGERLALAGPKGVAVGVEIAGPGSRSYAFLIDWHIRLLLALAWFAAAWIPDRLLHDAPASGPHFWLVVLLPALAIYFLYHPVIELLLQGRTPGKRLVGLRLVTRSGGIPGPGALLVRNVWRLLDCLPGFYLLGLVCCFLSKQRLRLGDLAAGTLLVVEPSIPAAEPLALTLPQTLPGRMPQLIEELLQRWAVLEPAQRAKLARALLARVPVHARPSPPATLRADEDAALREQLRALLTRA